MLDSFTEDLKRIDKSQPDSGKMVMKTTFDFVKTLEYEKIRSLKSKLEQEDEILKKNIRKVEKKKRKEDRNKRKLLKKKLKEGKEEKLEEGQIPKNIQMNMEDYENAFNNEAEMDCFMDLSKFFEDKNMIPISNTDVERIIPFINIEENLCDMNNSNSSFIDNSKVISKNEDSYGLDISKGNKKRKFSEMVYEDLDDLNEFL